MAVVPFQIETTDTGELTARAVDRALKGTYLAVAEHWVQKFLPLHFRSGNATRYSMKPRSARWLAKKQRLAQLGYSLYGGRVLLVDRGTMANMIRQGLTIRAYPTRATVKLPGPSYLKSAPNPTGRGRSRPHMAAEILRIIPEEERELHDVAGRRLGELLTEERARHGKRKRKTN